MVDNHETWFSDETGKTDSCNAGMHQNQVFGLWMRFRHTNAMRATLRQSAMKTWCVSLTI